uniref:Patatin n=2 Tax=Auxenochlorella protothecoides TaxID=3075 RepID=A0A1D2AF26_AUXPR
MPSSALHTRTLPPGGMTSVLHAHAASRASCRLVNGRTSTAPGQCKGPRRHGQTSWRLDAVKYPFASLIQQLKGTKESQSVQDEHYPETTGRPQPDCPIISCCGGGIFFFWELGVLLYLQKQFDLGGVQVRGASAGALLSTLVACDVDLEKALASATVRIRRVEAMERKLGLVGLAGQLVGDWLADLLPEDAAQRAHRRGLHIVVTEVPSFRLTTVKRFDSKQDLVQANLASTHIPFFTDGAPSYDYKGQPCIDGSLWDFVFADNSDYLKAEGRAVLVDYFKDDQLSTNRLDFIRLASPDEILSLVGFGYRYASRADEAGEFELALGRLRRSPLSRLVSGGFLPGFLFGSG